MAPLVGVLLNLYAWIDVVAVVPSLMDWAYKRDASLGSMTEKHGVAGPT